MLAWRKKMEYPANFPLCATFVSSTRVIFGQRVINAFPDALNFEFETRFSCFRQSAFHQLITFSSFLS